MIEHDELRQLLDEVRDVTAAMASHGAALRDRAAIPTGRTGFGSRASGAEPSNAPGHMTVLTDTSWECLGCGAQGGDDLTADQIAQGMAQHTEETRRSIDYSDRTGDMALRPSGADPLAAGFRDFLRLTREMLDRGRIAYEILGHNHLLARSAPEATCPPEWCQSCWRYDKRHEPIATGRYARWCRRCGDWAGTHAGQPPPLSLVKAMHDHGKLSPRMIAEAEREHVVAMARQRRAPKKRRRAS